MVVRYCVQRRPLLSFLRNLKTDTEGIYTMENRDKYALKQFYFTPMYENVFEKQKLFFTATINSKQLLVAHGI